MALTTTRPGRPRSSASTRRSRRVGGSERGGGAALGPVAASAHDRSIFQIVVVPLISFATTSSGSPVGLSSGPM